jgi:hypothetical protein
VPFEIVDRPQPWPERPDRHAPRTTRREFLIAEIQAWAAQHDGRQPTHADWNIAVARRRGLRFERGWPSTGFVIGCFGRWDKGIAAAGFTPHPTGRRVTNEARAREVIALRRDGLTARQIAARMGLKERQVGAAVVTAHRMGLTVPPAMASLPRFPVKTCENCGREYAPSSNNAKASKACSRKCGGELAWKTRRANAAAGRAQATKALAAMILNRTPEEIEDYLRTGFPPEVDAFLQRTGEYDEAAANVAILQRLLG